MRKVILYIIIGVLLLLAAILLSKELSPYNTEKLEELVLTKEIQAGDEDGLNAAINELMDRGLIVNYLSENAYVIIFCGLIGIFFLFVAIHLIIDKIFFKNFYETPSSINAIRRGFLLVTAISLLLFAKLNNAESYVMVLIIMVPFLLEVVINLSSKKDTEVEESVVEEITVVPTEGKHIAYEDGFEHLDAIKEKEQEL